MVAMPYCGPAGLGALAAGAELAPRANRRGNVRLRLGSLGIAGAGGIAAALGFALIPLLLAPPAASHAYAACVFMLALFGGLHVGLAALGSAILAARCRAGFVSRVRANDLMVLRLWCRFAAGSGAILLSAIYLLPLLH